jgi:hypothetical protein
MSVRVAGANNIGWSFYRAPWLQPVATMANPIGADAAKQANTVAVGLRPVAETSAC